ncbi:hypothetical protein FI667_g5266, partial [Globisporangium splendens]
MGDHAADRYRRFRRFVEAQDEDVLDEALFGLLLSAETMRDEMRAYDEQPSALLRLAQTGHFVRQSLRLHGLLDAASAAYPMDEPPALSLCEGVLKQERTARVARFNEMLASLNGDDVSETMLAREIETDSQQEEVLTLLMTGLDKYQDVLNEKEARMIQVAFDVVALRCNVIVMTLPGGFVAPFEFGGTCGLLRWGNDLFIPQYVYQARFIKEVSVWSELNHPHIAKFLGACHDGNQPFIAHEKVRSLTEYATNVKDRKVVWQRFYVVALALQYLQERGFGCRQLLPHNVLCAQYEDKAILLGVSFVELRRENGSTGGDNAEGDYQRTSCVASDIVALSLLIVNILDEMTSPARAARIEQPDRFQSMPTHLPDCLDEAEWDYLHQITCVDAESEGAMLQMDATIGEVIVTELQQIADVLSRCDSMIGRVDDLTAHVQSRFADIYLRLCEIQANREHDEPTKDAIAYFASLHVRLYRFLEQKTNSYANCFSDSLASCSSTLSQRELATTFFFHTDIDRFMALHNVASSTAVHSWKPDWTALCWKLHWFIPAVQALEMVYAAIRSRLPLVQSVQSGLVRGGISWEKVRYTRRREAYFHRSEQPKLNHINIVEMYGACYVDTPFFVCEFARGGELGSYLKKNGWEPYLIWYSLLNAALGLQYLHDNGIVHGDLKGNNIMLVLTTS